MNKFTLALLTATTGLFLIGFGLRVTGGMLMGIAIRTFLEEVE